jgi:hypothetical protein
MREGMSICDADMKTFDGFFNRLSQIGPKGALPVLRGSLSPEYGMLTLQHESSAQERNHQEKDIEEGTMAATRQSKLAAITHGVAPPGMKGLIPILLGEAVTRRPRREITRKKTLRRVQWLPRDNPSLRR